MFNTVQYSHLEWQYWTVLWHRNYVLGFISNITPSMKSLCNRNSYKNIQLTCNVSRHGNKYHRHGHFMHLIYALNQDTLQYYNLKKCKIDLKYYSSSRIYWPLLTLTFTLIVFFSTPCFSSTLGIRRNMKFYLPSYVGITRRNIQKEILTFSGNFPAFYVQRIDSILWMIFWRTNQCNTAKKGVRFHNCVPIDPYCLLL